MTEKGKETKIPPDLRRRNKGEGKPEVEEKPISVSAGAIPRILDYVFNPTRDKIREVTSIDRIQGHLLPQLDIVDLFWQYAIEIAIYRQDVDEYERLFDRKRPIPPNPIDEFTYRTAQWQKSIGGKNLGSAVDIALAETEARTEGEEGLGKIDAWGKDE